MERAETDRFLAAVGVSEVTFQTFDDTPAKRRELARVLHGTLDKHWDELARLNQAGAGVFWMVNEGDGKGRSTKNVTHVRALFVDDDSNSLELSSLGITPSVVVESRHGLHCYWLLDPSPSLDAFTPAQEALARALGTDKAVKDLPRVMRLPGFAHRKGDPFIVRVTQAGGQRYSLEDVLECNGATLAEPAPAPAPRGSDRLERGRRYLAQAGPAVQGEQGDAKTFRVCAWLLNDLGLPHSEALSLLQEWNATNAPPWSEADLRSKLDNASQYGTHTPGAASAPQAATEALKAMNRDHFVLNDSGRVVICSVSYDYELRRSRLDRMAPSDFRLRYQPVKVEVPSKKEGTEQVEVAKLWLGWSGRRQYEGVALDPSGKVPNSVYNLWRGFSVTPKPGDWGMLRDHLAEVICNGDSTLFRYVLCWLARAVQRPDEQGQVALVLRGGEGAGKGVVGRTICQLFGEHGMHISNAKHLIGQFNGHLATTVFLFADEAFYAGDKSHVSQLKALITEPTIMVEAKYANPVSMRNRLHVLMASNEGWAVPASLDARRFAVLDVSSRHQRERGYFDRLHQSVKDPGVMAAMLEELQGVDLEDYDVFAVPNTSALQEQKIHSLTGSMAWLLDVLSADEYRLDRASIPLGAHEGNKDGWHSTNTLYASYCEWVPKRRGEWRTEPLKMFGATMRTVGERSRRRVNGSNTWGYALGLIESARSRFMDSTGLQCAFEDQPIREQEISNGNSELLINTGS